MFLLAYIIAINTIVPKNPVIAEIGISAAVNERQSISDIIINDAIRKELARGGQVFIVYNLLGFWYKGTNDRRFKEAFIFIPRKNGKTTFIAALAWGLAILERGSGAVIYIVAASLKQAVQSFDKPIPPIGKGTQTRIDTIPPAEDNPKDDLPF